MVPLGRDNHMLVPIPTEVDERPIEVQLVSDHDIEESRVMGEDALKEPLGGGRFSLAGPEQLDVQDQGQALADQVADHPLVIVFRHRLPGDGEHAALAIRAAPLATGEELMAIDRRGVPAFMAGERLVALEPVGDVAEHLPQRRAVHQRIDAADGVHAGDPGSHDAAQPRGDAQVLLQAVEAAATSGEEGEDTGEGRRGGDLRTQARIG